MRIQIGKSNTDASRMKAELPLRVTDVAPRHLSVVRIPALVAHFAETT